jgi:hypothetical protein
MQVPATSYVEVQEKVQLRLPSLRELVFTYVFT